MARLLRGNEPLDFSAVHHFLRMLGLKPLDQFEQLVEIVVAFIPKLSAPLAHLVDERIRKSDCRHFASYLA